MYVPEFLCGIVATILVEFAILVTVALWKGGRKK